MVIHKASPKQYAEVKPEFVGEYITEYLEKANAIIKGTNKPLKACNKTQLNTIAAELETVCKRLDYILNGNY